MLRDASGCSELTGARRTWRIAAPRYWKATISCDAILFIEIGLDAAMALPRHAA
jgi:hypothetical protein